PGPHRQGRRVQAHLPDASQVLDRRGLGGPPPGGFPRRSDCAGGGGAKRGTPHALPSPRLRGEGQGEGRRRQRRALAPPGSSTTTRSRSSRFVLVGPVPPRSPSAANPAYESLASSFAAASSPRSRARATVSPSAIAPAASVGPSVPSVPAASTARPS